MLKATFLATLAITAFALSMGASVSMGASAGKLIYPDRLVPAFEREDEPSRKQGFKKCEISIVLNANLGAEFVDFRVKMMTNGKQVITTLTVDVVEYTISNGIPYDPKKRPISNVEVVSNILETTSTMPRTDMGDGGKGIVLDASSFASIIKLIERGDYVVAFKRNDRAEETLYAVKDGVDRQVIGQYNSCVQRM